MSEQIPEPWGGYQPQHNDGERCDCNVREGMPGLHEPDCPASHNDGERWEIRQLGESEFSTIERGTYAKGNFQRLAPAMRYEDAELIEAELDRLASRADALAEALEQAAYEAGHERQPTHLNRGCKVCHALPTPKKDKG